MTTLASLYQAPAWLNDKSGELDIFAPTPEPASHRPISFIEAMSDEAFQLLDEDIAATTFTMEQRIQAMGSIDAFLLEWKAEFGDQYIVSPERIEEFCNRSGLVHTIGTID